MESKINIENLIKYYSREYINNPSCKPLEKLENYIENYLKTNTDDYQMWVKLALVVYTRPLADDPKAIDCLDKINFSHPLYPKALLIKTYIQEGYHGLVKKDASVLLNLIDFIDEKDLKSLLYYMASQCYIQEDVSYQKKLLFKSIEVDQSSVWPYITLGCLHLQIDFFQAQYLLLRGLKNIKKIGYEYIIEDISNIDNFIDSNIRGIFFTQPSFEGIIQSLLNHFKLNTK